MKIVKLPDCAFDADRFLFVYEGGPNGRRKIGLLVPSGSAGLAEAYTSASVKDILTAIEEALKDPPVAF